MDFPVCGQVAEAVFWKESIVKFKIFLFTISRFMEQAVLGRFYYDEQVSIWRSRRRDRI